jgi:hypothetical protein
MAPATQVKAPIEHAKDAQAMLGFVTFISVILGVITFFFDTYRKGKQADDLAPLSDKKNMGRFASQKPTRLGYLLFWRRTDPKPVPRVQLVVETGDDLLYTSSVFDQMKVSSLPMQVNWVGIFTAIFDTIAYRCVREEIEVKLPKTSSRILSNSMHEVRQLAQKRHRSCPFFSKTRLI